MYRHLLVAYNGTASSTRALTTALRLAREWNGEVRVLCVAETPPPIPPVSGWELELARLDQDRCLGGWLMRASALGRDYAVPVRLAVSAGRPATAIVDYAARRSSELVVIGRHALALARLVVWHGRNNQPPGALPGPRHTVTRTDTGGD